MVSSARGLHGFPVKVLGDFRLGKPLLEETESENAFLILKSFEKLRPFFRKERGHNYGGLHLKSRALSLTKTT